MKDPAYLIVHKDHPITIRGVNSGAETATLWLARALAASGRRVVLCAQFGEEPGRDEDFDQGVTFWNLGANFDTRRAIVRARELGSYHLIAACRAQAIIDSKNERSCVSRTFIAHDPSAGASGIKLEILSRLVDNIICVSEAQKALFVQAQGDASKIHVVPNGADLSFFTAGDPARRDYKKLLFVGALVVDKGIHVLINAFGRIKQKHPDATLDVYGSSSMWGRGDLFNPQDVEKSIPGVRFYGAVPQRTIAEVFKTAGACVISSIYFDSFPLTAVEAQVSGCPVIGFDSGGIREAMNPGHTGVLISQISEEALAQALDTALASPQTLRAMSEAAMTWARATFSWEKVVARITQLCEDAARSHQKPTGGVIGYLSTWNQKCGLATYARFMTSAFPKGSFVVLGEQISVAPEMPDEKYVERCWKRGSGDFTALESAITKHNVRLLHLNCHYSFFPQPAFGEFLSRMRQRGVIVVTLIHNPYTANESLSALVKASDAVVVHCPENRLEVIANGAKPECVHVIPHGVLVQPELSTEERKELRHKLSMRDGEASLVAFGFVQPHKGLEQLIDTVAVLQSRGIESRGFICGNTMAEDPQGEKYVSLLKRFAQEAGVGDRIVFLGRFLNEQEVQSYLRAADIVLLNYRSQHFEASGACALAVGSGSITVTSIAPPFLSFHDAVWHSTSGFPPALAIEMILGNPELQGALKAQAKAYCRDNSWEQTSYKIFDLYKQLSFIPDFSPQKEQTVEHRSTNTNPQKSSGLRVLMQNRPGTFTQRGGDTVVIERLVEGLTRRGVDVVVDVEGREDPSKYSLVHLFNFATPDLTRSYAERAVQAGTPFVVTTLAEDIPSFHTQSREFAGFLVEYTRRGQDRNWYNSQRPNLNALPRVNRFNNDWVAERAASLFPNGKREAEVLRRDYPRARRIDTIPLGYEVGAIGNKDLFIQQYGVKDFVLCVGRLESRKNQLLLLRALEDSDVTIVLAGGGFSYQPEYEQAIRSFRRKGRTIVTDRLSAEMLASAYAAAKVHVLPSWHELPGLVSLEAAAYGCNVVVTDQGTTRDYLGDYAFYADPSSEISLYNAVMAAYYAPVRPELKAHVLSFTWEKTCDMTYAMYRECAKAGMSVTPSAITLSTNIGAMLATVPAPPTPTPNGAFLAALEKAEDFAKARDYGSAVKGFDEAGRIPAPTPELQGRLYRARGAVYLAQNMVTEAKQWLSRSVEVAPNDSKGLCGVGMCEMMEGNVTAAYAHFVQSLDRDPNNVVTLRQMVECSYRTSRFDDLARILEGYVSRNPSDHEMEFCLAGAYYMLKRTPDAERIIQGILAVHPNHKPSNDLMGKIVSDRQPVIPLSTPVPGATLNKVIPSIASLGFNSAPTMQPRQPSTFDYNDSEILKLEEEKRKKNIPDVIAGCTEMLKRPTLSSPQREQVTLLRAEGLVLSGELESAEQVYDSVLAGNARSARALVGKGALYASRSQWIEAKSAFSKALEYNPGYDVAHSGLGLCAHCVKDYETAWSHYQLALKSNPENTRALLGLIEIGYMNKRFSEVEVVLRNYLDAHPADLSFVYSLAGCLFSQNRHEEALAEVGKVLLFDPENKNAHELREIIESKKAGRSAAAGGW